MSPCILAAAISLDAVDISGSHDDDNSISVAHNGELHKVRINADGSRKGLGEYIAPKQQWGPFTLRRPQEVTLCLCYRFVMGVDQSNGCVTRYAVTVPDLKAAAGECCNECCF